MKKKVYKIVLLLMIALFVLMCFSCKKKPKHRWIEVGANPVQEKVTPGVHPERGTASDAIDIVLAPVYFPLGRDKEGKPQYKKILYELEELTPEALDEAFKNVGLIDEASVFCDLFIEESDVVLSAGPGADESQLTKKGTVRYLDLSTSRDNSDDYEGKYYAKDIEGMINMDDIFYCITKTFEENFQLVSCEMGGADLDLYNSIHNK